MRALRSWVFWWLVLFGLWNVLQGAWEAMEIAAGAGAAAVGATFADVARRQGLLSFAPEAKWLARSVRLLWRLPYEFCLVAFALVRPVRSEWATAPLPGGRYAAVARGNRAATLAIENVSPNIMAIEAENGDEALKHDLVPNHGTTALPS